ncbi:MAG TPA: riboflavin kinase [Bacteroidales bacterium]|nr:riboflavin kinase [Bacteroidales bacterium]
MRIFRNFEGVEIIQNAVVTTGSFDGVHVGHRAIINNLNKSAKELVGESTLITFYPHPRKVLYPDTLGKKLMLINSQREKIELLKKTGLNNLIIVDFTIAFSKMSSVDFVRKILIGKLNAKKIIVGFNHHFGYNREGDFDYLRELAQYYNFLVEEIPEQDIQNETVSSTKIRQALIEGNIQKANAYLDHHYMIMGQIKKGNELLNEAFPIVYSINIEEECKLIPPEGVYAIHLNFNNTNFKGIAIIHKLNNINFLSVDFHLFDKIEYLEGNDATLFFHKLIRKNNEYLKFDDWKYILNIDKEKVIGLIY